MLNSFIKQPIQPVAERKVSFESPASEEKLKRSDSKSYQVALNITEVFITKLESAYF